MMRMATRRNGDVTVKSLLIRKRLLTIVVNKAINITRKTMNLGTCLEDVSVVTKVLVDKISLQVEMRGTQF